jgi:SAM-dependent methyltransferase
MTGMDTMTRRPRLHDWVSLGAAVATIVAIAALLAGHPALTAICLVGALGAAVAARISSQRHPGPMPYWMRWVLYLPRWPLSAARLRSILEVQPGEQMLELGPGVGIYALPIASALMPGGRLSALDIQPEMLAVLTRRARSAGVTNLVANQGDAQRLPYPDASFDAAYLIGVLGEIPDPAAALGELRRVLKPGGRLVVGEVLLADPDAVRLPTLCALARQAGFELERRTGPRFAYFARFRLRA